MAPAKQPALLRLNSGYDIMQLGFGVYQIPAERVESCVRIAFGAGYRQIDSAFAYRNQAGCGRAILAAAVSTAPSPPGAPPPLEIPRSQLFYTSKVRPKNLSYDSAKEQVDATLRETGLDYIDLMLIHSPFGGPVARKGAWRALVEAVDAGKVRSLGVSNYGIAHLNELVAYIDELEKKRSKGPGGGGSLSVGQWEVHPWLPRRDIVEWCRSRGVVVQAYCPLVRGQKFGQEGPLRELAEKYGKTEAQILVRWSLQKGLVPLPKSGSEERIRENAQVFDFVIEEDDMKRLELDVCEPCAWDPTVSGLDN